MEIKIGEFDLRNLPQEMSLGMRGILLRMSLEIKLRQRCGSTDDELESHEKLMELCNDHRFAEGTVEINNFFGKMSEEDRFELQLFEELYYMGINNTVMPMDTYNTDTGYHFNIEPSNGEEMLYRMTTSEDIPFFGEFVRYNNTNCN